MSRQRNAENEQVVRQIQAALTKKGWSRETLAQRAKIALATVNKGMSGERPFSDKSLMKMEGPLGITLLAAKPSRRYAAATELGAYSRELARDFEGDYVTLRASFFEPNTIVAYRTEISWVAVGEYLQFNEFDRADAQFAQGGRVALPQQTGFVYLITNERGQHRLATLRRTITGELYGILLALRAARGGHLTPAATPYALVPLQLLSKVKYGVVSDQDEIYPVYQRHLSRVLSENYAKLFLC